MTPPDTAAAVRAALARAAFGLPNDPLPTHVGPLPLRPHQQTAVARLRRALATHRGALLADAVGLGKTRVALALAAEAAAPLVVAPAALRAMWHHAAASARVSITFASTESLGAPNTPRLTPADLVVVDEAHHFRTPGTRRRARLADAAATARVLLLSATPVHNATRDLTALLALFLGDTAGALDAATLAHLVVRRRRRDLHTPDPADARPPRVRRTAWQQVAADHRVLDALVGIPPPLPAVDAGHAPALATLTLVRLWTSSDAALRAALRRRLARAAALAHTLAAGHHPTRRDLATCIAGDDAVQLPLLFGRDTPLPNATALRRAVEAHAAALRRALATLDAAPPADPARLAWLCAVRARHPGARVVAFTQFADTARAVFRALAPAGHVGLLTAAGGRIASGPLPRDALLARFAPRATGAPDPPAIERVDCLVTTDCLSEGLDLRDAGVVAHLDVPWTPARLAQRVGRAARLGAEHAEVFVYGLKPSRPAERWLRLARRLRAKARAGRAALGELPRAAPDRALARHAAAHRHLERWLLDAPPALPPAPAVAIGARPCSWRPPLPVVAVVRCGRTGFVAVWQPHGPAPPVLVAEFEGRASAAPALIARALRHLARAGAVVLPSEATTPSDVARARAAVHAWAARRAARTAVGHLAAPALDAPRPAPVNTTRAALVHADAALRAAPPHARAAQATAAAHLRAQLGSAVSNADGHMTAVVLLRA